MALWLCPFVLGSFEMKIYADEIKAMVERVDAKLAPLCDYGGM